MAVRSKQEGNSRKDESTAKLPRSPRHTSVLPSLAFSNLLTPATAGRFPAWPLGSLAVRSKLDRFSPPFGIPDDMLFASY